MPSAIPGIWQVLLLAERLKCELRHSWLSNGRQESVAEHTWQMALMAILMHRYLEHPVDLARTLQMVIVHDLIEAETGDVPYFETGTRQAMKAERERAAIDRIRDLLPAELGQDVHGLWHEFEARETPEARFAKALDHLEVQIQHNRAAFDTWQEIEQELVYTKMDGPCAHDAFLKAFCDTVKADAETKMKAAGLDTEAVRLRAGSGRRGEGAA